MGGENSRTGNI